MKQKKYCIKNLVFKLISCIMVSFLVITSYAMPKKEDYTIYADTYTPIQKQSFVTWLLSYFGINIYTDAQQISDDLYTAVKLAYDAYLATLQPQQKIEFDDIADLVTWDNARPNVLKLPGTVYNVIKGFANYVSSKIYDPSDVQGLEIGTFETVTTGSYIDMQPNVEYYIGTNVQYGGHSMYIMVDKPARIVGLINNNNYCGMNVISLDRKCKARTRQDNTSWGSWSGYYSSANYNGTSYYSLSHSTYPLSGYNNLPLNHTSASNTNINNNTYYEYYTYSYGDSATVGDTTLNDIYALPKQSILDDLIGAADPEEDMLLDLDGSDIAYSTALTLEDIIGMINEAVNGYVLDDSYPDTAAKIAAQSQAIDNELTDVDYPNASNWEVPQSIGTPQILPLLQPDCPDLSACLVAGIQDVGTSLGSVIEANSNVSNYVSVILFMGIALTILGGI